MRQRHVRSCRCRGQWHAHAQGRCGYGPRLPMMAISPWARVNYVDHVVLDQTSIIRFVEDNWLNGQRISGGSFDSVANSIDGMFDWSAPTNATFTLSEESGEIVSYTGVPASQVPSPLVARKRSSTGSTGSSR